MVLRLLSLVFPSINTHATIVFVIVISHLPSMSVTRPRIFFLRKTVKTHVSFFVVDMSVLEMLGTPTTNGAKVVVTREARECTRGAEGVIAKMTAVGDGEGVVVWSVGAGGGY